MLPKVVAIVLNWNLPGETCACVKSLLASDYPGLQVIVVDNGSTDGSVGIFQARLPGIEIVALPENRGYAAGNNAGLARALAAGAGWVLLVNNDAILAVDAVSRLVAAAGPSIGLVMPRIDEAPSGRLWRAGSRVRGLSPLPRPVLERDLAKGTPLEIDYAVGCVLLIRRDVLETIGFLDEHYYMYYEDLDFSSRVRGAGFRIVVVPDARVAHQVGASLKKDSVRRTYLLTRYRTLWCRSQSFGLTGLAWWASLAVGSLRGIVDAESHGSLSRAASVVRGLRDGLRQSR